jgi:hypothetical protein
MYNGGFIAQNILCTASQDIGLFVKCKISYVNCASMYSIYKLMSEELASLKLPTGVPAGSLYFLWTHGFPSTAVEA